MPYPTVDQVKEYLPADTELTDAEIGTILTLAIETVESICGQRFEPVTRSIIVDGSGRMVQPLPAPLQSVTAIEFRQSDGSWSAVTYGDIRIGRSRKMLSAGNAVSFSQQVLRGVRRSAWCCGGSGGLSGLNDYPNCVFPAGFQNIRVTGAWGRWADVPVPIADAIGRLVEYAGSCDNPTGSVNEPFMAESVPGGRSYTMREILRDARANRMTGFADVDAVLARYPATFGTTTVL